MKWFAKEKRNAPAVSSTDVVLAGLIARANVPPCSINETAAARTAALCWGRALSGATVEGAEIPAAVLFDIGVDLVLAGESLHEISTTGGRLRLLRAASWTVAGPPDKWRYLIQRAGPDTGQTSRPVAADAVVHNMWTTESRAPWRGIGPFAGAALTARLLAELENSSADEMSGPTGHLLALPIVPETDELNGFKDSIPKLRGQIAIHEGGNWGLGERGAGGIRTSRIGAEPSHGVAAIALGRRAQRARIGGRAG